jgi:hypothetical protein
LNRKKDTLEIISDKKLTWELIEELSICELKITAFATKKM